MISVEVVDNVDERLLNSRLCISQLGCGFNAILIAPLFLISPSQALTNQLQTTAARRRLLRLSNQECNLKIQSDRHKLNQIVDSLAAAVRPDAVTTNDFAFRTEKKQLFIVRLHSSHFFPTSDFDINARTADSCFSSSDYSPINFLNYAKKAEAFDWMVGIRRKIHKNPEQGYEEFETSKLIKDELDEMGIPYKYPLAVTGVVCSKNPLIVAMGADRYSFHIGIEAKGFIFRPPIVLATGAKFVPMRKPKKLPGQMTDELRNFLELNLPKVKEGKKPKFSLGVAEPKLGSHIDEVTKIPWQNNGSVLEFLRGVRMHFRKFIWLWGYKGLIVYCEN